MLQYIGSIVILCEVWVVSWDGEICQGLAKSRRLGMTRCHVIPPVRCAVNLVCWETIRRKHRNRAESKWKTSSGIMR